MKMQHTRQPRQAGFSLVELMIAMTLGLLLAAAIGALFVANKRNYTQNSLIAEMQDNGRFALQELSRDLAMAGFLGGMDGTPGEDANLEAPATDCGPGADGQAGWAYDSDPVELDSDVTPSDITALYSCLGAADVLAGTDILSLRHTAGLATAERQDAGSAVPTLATNTTYLATNRTSGMLFFSGASGTIPDTVRPNTAPLAYWEYNSRLYYVRPYARSAGDGIPTLCRFYLKQGATTGVANECLAEGVEDMQIAFGIDTNGDGAANRYLTDPGQAQLGDAVTARIQLLMRSVEPDRSYDNDKTYNLIGKDDDGDGDVDEPGDGRAPADHFYRRIMQTTVQLNNAALQTPATP